MESTNVNQPARTPRNKSVAIGLAMLVIGILIGAVAMKYAGGGSSATRSRAAGGGASDVSSSSTTGALSQSGEWNPFKEMREMQAEMDRVFQRSFERLRANPHLGAFKEDAGYSLELDVRDLKDRFEVRALLPDAKASDAKVNLDNNQTLKVEVTHKETEKSKKGAEPTVTEWGRYEQTIQLPASVKADRMKVEHKDHELLITLPKA
jgi:HSP20 family protein